MVRTQDTASGTPSWEEFLEDGIEAHVVFLWFMPYLYLGIAILAEVIGTSALKKADGFSNLTPSLVVVAGYGIAFYFMSLSIRSISIGIAYAIWSGVGIVLISLAGWVLYKQSLDAPAIAGMGLILVGVLVINLFSKTAAH